MNKPFDLNNPKTNLQISKQDLSLRSIVEIWRLDGNKEGSNW